MITISFSLYGQLDDISMLGINAESLSQISDSGVSNDFSKTSNFEEINIQQDDADDYKEEVYGYSGIDSFNNPPQKKFSKEPLQRFGYSLFSKQSSSFVSLTNFSVPVNYFVGPDDVINIILFGNKNKNYQLKINRDGEVFIPEVGPVSIAGLNFEDAKELIISTVETQFIGTEASVSLGSLRSIDVFILGAAKNPGMYSVSALSTMINALVESGGVDSSGSLRNIKLKRNGKTITNLDLYKLLIEGDTSGETRLNQGDVIFIEPLGKTAGIRGEVNRQGIYELKKNENLEDLFNFAGKFKAKADKKNVELLRIDQSSSSYQLLKVNFEKVTPSENEVNDGDLISVYPVNNKIKNAILLKGHTLQPGFYPWRQGMKIMDVFKGPDDMMEMTDLNYVLIKRKNLLTQGFSFFQVDLEDAFNNNSTNQNIELYDQDEILLLPSLLSPELIVTKSIQEQQINDPESETQIIEEEWSSLTYLRKSLRDYKEDLDDNTSLANNASLGTDETTLQQKKKYYEYTIFDYCMIPADSLFELIMDNEENSIEEQDSDQNISLELTKICRDQLLEPILNLVKRENSTEKLSLVSVYGGVHFPGEYPFTRGMSLAEAINASGGTQEGIFNSEIEITSLNNQGNKFISSNLKSNISNAKKTNLKRMDLITVKKLSNQIRTVEITGEVYFPGVYPITENQTLSQLIQRAGGLTAYSDPRAANFQRVEIKEAEIKRMKNAQRDLERKIVLAGQASDFGETALDSSQMAQLTNLIDVSDEDYDSLGRLVIDLEGIISGNKSDIELRDGDTIQIPKNRQSITVIGEVYVANAHLYDNNLGIDDYIRLSGGETEFADNSNIYIIKADGSIIPSEKISSGFFRSSNSQLESGDTIVVPLEIGSFSQLRAASEITQIIYQMAIAAAAVNSF